MWADFPNFNGGFELGSDKIAKIKEKVKVKLEHHGAHG